MHIRIRCSLSLLGLVLAFATSPVLAQKTSSRPDGWQGPWPGDWQGTKSAPQKELPVPAPQRTIPSGKQVMEIPRQQSMPPAPRQQAEIPPHPQSEGPRPTQFIPVTVTDRLGRYVAGLQPGDFTLYEDDEAQRITYFNTGEKEPISMGLLIDTSGSMEPKINHARVALRRLIDDAVRPRDEIFLEAFSTRPVLLQDFTDSRLLLARALGMLRPAGGTALYDAMLDALPRVLRGQNLKKALFVISDGDDTNSFNSLEQTILAARRAGVLIYAVGIQGFGGGPVNLQLGPFSLGSSRGVDDARGARILQEATSQTGGTLFTLGRSDMMGTDSVLDKAIRTISRELRSQYSLGYTPTKRGNQYRNVRVTVRQAEAEQLTVRTPKGYAVDGEKRVVETGRW